MMRDIAAMAGVSRLVARTSRLTPAVRRRGPVMNKDIQHLNLLAVFHYLVGALMMLISSIFIFHLVIGVIAIISPSSLGGTPPPLLIGWVFALLGGAAVFLGWSLGIALMIAGWFLHRRTHHLYCFIMACFSLMFQPFGTVLGVFTIIVLMRPSVKHLFATGEAPYDPEDDEFRDVRMTMDSYNIHDER
jgi:hypothetical protein